MTVPITRWSMICFLGSFQAIYIGQWNTAHNSFLFFSFNRCFHGEKRSSTVIINGIIFGHFQFFPFFIKQPTSTSMICRIKSKRKFDERYSSKFKNKKNSRLWEITIDSSRLGWQRLITLRCQFYEFHWTF